MLKINKLCLWCIPLVFAINAKAQKLQVTHLLCAYQTNPIGIDAVKPILNWQLVTNQQDVLQAAYRVLVADDSVTLKKDQGNIWDSEKVSSGQSIQIPYNGKTLQSAKTYYWKVMVWDNKGNASAWSKTAMWQMGLLNASDWRGAKWIGYDKLPASMLVVPAAGDKKDKGWYNAKDILPLLRKEFAVKKAIKTATVYISGLGQFDLSLNGKKIGDHFMDPGWTKYDKQALYVTFDITQQIKSGQNAIGVMLGNGFYYIPGERYHKLSSAFGYPKMICRLALQYQDGSAEDIVSNNSWKASAGPVTFSSIYGGEDYDATLEQKGWDTPQFKDQTWKPAVVVTGPPQLDAQMEQPLKIFDHFKAQKITQPKPGVWVYDMGQNASGIPYIAVKGKKGMTVKITPAELLGSNGLITQNAVGSPVFLNYTLKGEGTETWQPRFMYYGFRYIQIENAAPAGEANPNSLPVITDVQSLHTRNSADKIGDFSCSNNLFNKTFTLIDWAIKSNTSSVFTDCPTREKLGWLEEAHLVGSSIRYNYDIATLCRKVITDMKLSQTADGLIPDIAPEYVEFGGGFRDSPEWGSNGIILPWYVYQWYNDKQVLEGSYNMMTRYVAYLENHSNNHILSFGLGDWYDIGPKSPGTSQLTPKGITGTAFYYYDLTILSRVAKILGKPEDEAKYKQLAAEVRAAFNAGFFNNQTKQYGTGSQAANAIAVYMGLVEPQNKDAVVANIVADVKKHNNSLTAGDIGYRYLLRVLDDAGRSDVIYDMNNRLDVPGYGYQLAKGATALTESWQGSTNASNNHFMLGHLMEWFYSGLGGIRSADNALAFNDIVIRPQPVGDLTFAKASYQSPYGLISSGWQKNDSLFLLDVTIPANTTATIYLPAKESSIITTNGTTIDKTAGNTFKDGCEIVKVGSGTYHFEVK